jgi:hypothetical protein
MAFQAIGPELVVVNIFVAIRAVLVPDSGKFLEFFTVPFRYFMAANAQNTGVLTPQGVFGCGVIELLRRFERILGMAVRAFSRQCPLMIILMAGKAFLIQSQIGDSPLFL